MLFQKSLFFILLSSAITRENDWKIHIIVILVLSWNSLQNHLKFGVIESLWKIDQHISSVIVKENQVETIVVNLQ